MKKVQSSKVIIEGETSETPRAWNERINYFLAKASFHKCRMENGVYAKSKIAKTNFYIFFFLLTLWLSGEGGSDNLKFGTEVKKSLAKNCPHQESNSGSPEQSVLGEFINPLSLMFWIKPTLCCCSEVVYNRN
jgi:hypothetical protein